MKIVGTTPEGKPVWSGTLQFSATYGLPFDWLVEEIHLRGGVVDWTSNVQEVLKQGSNLERAVNAWDVIVSSIYDQEWVTAWRTRLRVYIANQLLESA